MSFFSKIQCVYDWVLSNEFSSQYNILKSKVIHILCCAMFMCVVYHLAVYCYFTFFAWTNSWLLGEVWGCLLCWPCGCTYNSHHATVQHKQSREPHLQLLLYGATGPPKLHMGTFKWIQKHPFICWVLECQHNVDFQSTLAFDKKQSISLPYFSFVHLVVFQSINYLYSAGPRVALLSVNSLFKPLTRVQTKKKVSH